MQNWQNVITEYDMFRHNFLSFSFILLLYTGDGKMFQHAGLIFFLARVKFVPNFTLFCRKSELCRDFALFGVTLKTVNLKKF